MLHSSFGYCQFCPERVEEKNPLDNEGKTPLHKAIDNGHLHILPIFVDILGLENPTLTKSEAK